MLLHFLKANLTGNSLETQNMLARDLGMVSERVSFVLAGSVEGAQIV